MINWKELKKGDGVKYAYQNNNEYEEAFGTVSDITDDHAEVYVSMWDDDLIVNADNAYFCELIPQPTKEEHRLISDVMDEYWRRINGPDEDDEEFDEDYYYEDLCVGDLIDEMFGKEQADILTAKWAAFYGYEPIF